MRCGVISWARLRLSFVLGHHMHLPGKHVVLLEDNIIQEFLGRARGYAPDVSMVSNDEEPLLLTEEGGRKRGHLGWEKEDVGLTADIHGAIFDHNVRS